jgi:hypothetical protein
LFDNDGKTIPSGTKVWNPGLAAVDLQGPPSTVLPFFQETAMMAMSSIWIRIDRPFQGIGVRIVISRCPDLFRDWIMKSIRNGMGGWDRGVW